MDFPPEEGGTAASRADRECTARAGKRLWPILGGEGNIVELLVAIEANEGGLYFHGSAARAVLVEEETGGENFGDIDFVVAGINGENLEKVAKEALGPDWHVGARRGHENAGGIKTIEVANKEGRQVADIACARKDDRPDPAATIGDHLDGCFTPDGRLVAFEISVDRAENIRLRQIERKKEIFLDADTVRPDHVWLWFNALVTGKVAFGRENEAEQMIKEFMETRGEELVMWRQVDESNEDWMKRRYKTQGVPESRVREVGIRSFGRYNVEGVVAKLSAALVTDPERFWRTGMETGLLPAVFPVLRVVDEMPGVGGRIDSNLKFVRGMEAEKIWFEVFGPIMEEMFEPIRESGRKVEWCGHKAFSWKDEANPFIGIERIAGLGGEARMKDTLLEERILETNWRWKLMPFFGGYHGDRLLKILRRQRREFSSTTEFPVRSLARVSREAAAIAANNPLEVYALLTSYLPLGGEKLRGEIRKAALGSQD